MKNFLLLLVLLGATFAPAQTLRSGAVAFAYPVYGAYTFVLMGGGPNGVNKCPPVQNGFCYQNGTFHLLQSGQPGLCAAQVGAAVGCKFDGEIAAPAERVVRIDQNCEEIYFPITNGTLQLNSRLGLKTYSSVNAIYSQTLCNLDGANTSIFDAAGSLVIYLTGAVL